MMKPSHYHENQVMNDENVDGKMIHQVWWLPAYWFAKTLLLVWCMAPPPYRLQSSSSSSRS